MQTQLQQNVHETASIVQDWKNTIDEINTRLNAASAALAKAKQEGDVLRGRAATGDAAATDAFKAAQDAQAAAESALAELRQAALPKALSELAEAERIAGNAKRTAAQPRIDALKHQAVAAGARFDKAQAEGAAALELLQRVVTELGSYENDAGMISRYEARIGLGRIYNALPECIRSLPANPAAKFILLAESLRQYWNPPPEQPDEKAKAA
jgi:hypothetical protein